MLLRLPPSPPHSEAELLQRASSLAGLSLGKLAEQMQQIMPINVKREKGWVGQFLEYALGATAASKAEPDFQMIGVELKTLPLNKYGKPSESTFVNTISLLKIAGMTWETSLTRRKLARVLWVPFEADATIPLQQRRIGMPLLWSPNETQEIILRRDWQELTDMIALGQLEMITAHQGQYLQIRPKAANARSLCFGINEHGEKILTLPRGFYLRASFTSEILSQYYL